MANYRDFINFLDIENSGFRVPFCVRTVIHYLLAAFLGSKKSGRKELLGKIFAITCSLMLFYLR